MTQALPHPARRRRRRAACPTLLCAVAALVVLAGCSGDSEDGAPPEDVMAEARAQLDGTTGVQVSLTTEELPEGVDGVMEATGVGTHDPAFEGEIAVLLKGVRVTVPVVAVD